MATERTDQLLELIANEMLRLRIQLSDGEEDPFKITHAFAETLDTAIIGQRKQLGLPIGPDLPRRNK
jgi:hypothetical protein